MKGLIAGLVLMATAIGGSALASTDSTTSRPTFQVDAVVRHEPPELEVYAIVAVHGVTPKPFGVEVDVLFDREGINDRPELNLGLGRPGDGYALLQVQYWHEEGEGEEALPSPTNGRVTKAVIKTLDTVCIASGLC